MNTAGLGFYQNVVGTGWRAYLAVKGDVVLLGDAFGVLDKANWQTQRAQLR